MKKLLGVTAGVALALSCVATPIQAASSINTEEQRLLDYVSRGVEVNGESLSYPAGTETYDLLEEILATDGVNLTKAEVDTVKDSAKGTLAYFKGIEYIPTVEELGELINLSAPGLAVLGVKVAYDAVNDVLTFTTLDGEYLTSIEEVLTEGITAVVPPTSDTGKKDALEKTGENFTSTYALIGGLAVILAGAGIFTFRKKEALK